MEQIATYFSSGGVPATWLSPTVNIWERNWTARVTDGALTEIAGWFYIYNFNEYSNEKQYLYLFDWWATLDDSERYNNWANEMDAYSNKYSRWRTAAPMTNYMPKFDEINELLKIPKEDNTDILLKSIKEIKTLLNKPKSKRKEVNIAKLLGELEDNITLKNEEILSGTRLHLDWLNDVLAQQITESVDRLEDMSTKWQNEHKKLLDWLWKSLLAKFNEDKTSKEKVSKYIDDEKKEKVIKKTKKKEKKDNMLDKIIKTKPDYLSKIIDNKTKEDKWMNVLIKK